MRVTRHRDAEAFLAAAGGFLSEAEPENNLLLGIVGTLQRPPAQPALLLTVGDTQGPHLAAVITPPHKLVLSAGDAAAIPFLIQQLATKGVDLPGVTGLTDLAQTFAIAWASATGAEAEPQLDMTLLTLRPVDHAPKPGGNIRPATAGDLSWLEAWIRDESAEIFEDPADRKRSETATRAMLGQGRLLLLLEDDRPVSLAGFTEVGRGGVRIGPVYTPRDLRRRGHASALVSALAQRFFDADKTWCALFADVRNPESNRIYRRLGFSPHCSFRDFSFG